jgi:hypothetical protein
VNGCSERRGELIAIRARDTQQTTEKTRGKLFSGDSFPVPFPSALSFPLSLSLGSIGDRPSCLLLGSTEDSLDLSTRCGAKLVPRAAVNSEGRGDLEVYDRLFPAPKNTKTKVHSAPPLSTITLLMCSADSLIVVRLHVSLLIFPLTPPPLT